MLKVRTRSGRCGIALAGLIAAATPPALAQYPQGAVVQQLPQANDPAELLAGALRTLAIEPNNSTALMVAGRNALILGDPNAAVGFFGRASELTPRDGRAKAGLGSALVQLEKPKDALRLFAEASALGVADSAIAEDRGLAYDLIGDNRHAQADYAAVLAVQPDDDTARRRLALSQGIAGDKTAAIATLDPMIRKRDIAGWRAQTFVLAMNGDAAGAGAITHIMMPQQADMLQPFLVRLATLSPADKARAVHFGEMPQSGRPYSPTELATTGAPATYAARPAPQTQPQPRTERRQRIEVAPQAAAAPVAAAPSTVARPAVASATPGSPRAVSAPAAVSAPQVAMAAPARSPELLVGPPAPRRPLPQPQPQPAAVQPAPNPAPLPLPKSAAPAPVQTALVTNPAPLAATAFATAAPVPSPTASGVTAPVAAIGGATGPAAAAASAAPPAMTIAAAPAAVATTPLPASPVFSGAGHFDLPHEAAQATPSPTRPAATPRVEPRPASKPATEPAVRTDEPKSRRSARVRPEVAQVDDEAAETAPRRGRGDRDARSHGRHDRRSDDAAPDDASDRASDSKAKTDRSGHRRTALRDEADSGAKAKRGASSRRDAAANADAEAGRGSKGRGRSSEDGNHGEPGRVFVQVAGGANKDDMDKAWAGLRQKAPDLMKGHTASTTPLKATNRLLVGPFKSDGEAQAFVNKMAGKGLSGFTFKSARGQKIEKIDAAK